MINNTINQKTIIGGEVYLSQSNEILKTLLGSCVGIVLWHPDKKITVLIHYLLPKTKNIAELNNPNRPLDGRFGEDAIKIADNFIKKNNTTIQEYSAFIFGGSNMNPLFKKPISNDNIQFINETIQKLKLKVVHKDLGGTLVRTITFRTADGSFTVKKS